MSLVHPLVPPVALLGLTPHCHRAWMGMGDSSGGLYPQWRWPHSRQALPSLPPLPIVADSQSHRRVTGIFNWYLFWGNPREDPDHKQGGHHPQTMPQVRFLIFLTCPNTRFVWAGGTFFPVVLYVVSVFDLAGKRFWLTYACTTLEYNTVVVVC